MIFAEKIYYCHIEEFHLSGDEAVEKGFNIENDRIVIPSGAHFKLITNVGPSGFPVIEVYGEELDFARTEPFLVSFY